MSYQLIPTNLTSKFTRHDDGSFVVLSKTEVVEDRSHTRKQPEEKRTYRPATQDDLKYAYEVLKLRDFVKKVEDKPADKPAPTPAASANANKPA